MSESHQYAVAYAGPPAGARNQIDVQFFGNGLCCLAHGESEREDMETVIRWEEPTVIIGYDMVAKEGVRGTVYEGKTL